MPSTSLEMHQNRFRPGLCPGPQWGSLQHSLRPLAGGEGGSPRPPQEPHPLFGPSGFGHTGYAVSSPNTPPPENNPSYGLGPGHVTVSRRLLCVWHTASTRHTLINTDHIRLQIPAQHLRPSRLSQLLELSPGFYPGSNEYIQTFSGISTQNVLVRAILVHSAHWGS